MLLLLFTCKPGRGAIKSLVSRLASHWYPIRQNPGLVTNSPFEKQELNIAWVSTGLPALSEEIPGDAGGGVWIQQDLGRGLMSIEGTLQIRYFLQSN